MNAQQSTTIHVAIGNSDDRLTQAQWSAFVADVDQTIRFWATTVHGYWHSLPDAEWQNAAWAFEIEGVGREDLRKELADAARHHHQESIAWNESTTYFITPEA